MPEINGKLKIVNWNVGGAKYLELRSRTSDRFDPPFSFCRQRDCSVHERRRCDTKCREGFRKEVNDGLDYLINLPNGKPDIITLQEVVRYEPHCHLPAAKDVIDPPGGYRWIPFWLIDTIKHGARGKWDKVRKNGGWPRNAFFAQGNAVLIRETDPIEDGIAYYPVLALPERHQSRDRFRRKAPKRPFTRWDDPPVDDCMECVQLEPGMYFGDRDTEPRATLVTHVVLSGPSEGGGGGMREELRKPLDVFVINLHLTTLTGEREGIPDTDERAAQTRSRQLDTVLNKIVSMYNEWRRDHYRIRDKRYPVRKGMDTIERHPPIWVITGDFNFTPEAAEYQTMLRRGFIDLMPKRHMHGLAYHQLTKAQGPGKEPTITLDYVFAGPRLAALDPNDVERGIQGNTVNVDVKASDHYPLIVDLPISIDET